VPKLENRIGRGHWSVESRHRREWRRLVCMVVGAKAPPEPLKFARVTIDIHRAGKQPDPDNLVRSCKPILDGLQPTKSYRRNGKFVVSRGCGVIADDQAENFDGGKAHVVWHPATKRDQRVVITVEGADR